MARCTFTWENHGETLTCEVDGEHPQYPGDHGGTVDWHQATLHAPEGYVMPDGQDDSGKPYTVGYCDPA